jgi:uncharacterized protein (TIGR04255 family)
VVTLRFPDVEDVRLSRAPLTEVVCQVRFPTVLKILRNPPFELQELIAHRFAEYGEEGGLRVQVEAKEQEASAASESTRSGFHFLTTDRNIRLVLTADAYSLSTLGYTVWDDFARDLQLVDESIRAVYSLQYAKRIGLRYINQFTLSNTGIEDLDGLLNVLRPELIQFYRNDAWSDAAEGYSQVVVRDDSAVLAFRLAFGEQGPGPSVFLDLDLFEEGQIPFEGLIDRCNRYHDVIYRAFRWSLKPEALALFGAGEGNEA